MAAPMDCLESLEGEDSAERRASGVEVALPSDPAAPAPLCPHGPTLLFVKVSPGKEATRRFYACSACRDRKDCNFFQWEDEKLSEARLAAREIHNRRCQPPLSRAQCAERYLRFLQLPLTQRKFCRSCQQLLLPADWREHGEHQLMVGISVAQLRRPSQLLFPLENKKTHAQYLFTDRSCQFLAGLLATLGFRRVLCVGAPRLHEQIRLAAPGEKSNMRSLLLDIDFRYSQFYLEESFCRYNMFNHHFFDGELSEARLAAREIHNQRCQPPLSRAQCAERYLRFLQLPLTQRKFCRSCQQLLLPADWREHGEHQLMAGISVAQLRRPSQLLFPLENKKTHAQYLFTDRSCQFLAGLLATLGFRRVLCVGAPRLHEQIRLAAPGEKSNMRSLLLDIDFRYSQFYLEESFCRYNMFNHHFFDGEAALEVCKAFVQEEEGEGLIMVTDPPFGGLVEPLAVTFKKLIAMWKEGQSQDDSHKELPIFWIFPYFFESRICQFFPSFCMLDYQVDYDNHALYKHGKTGRKQSPVRIFTNIPPNKIILPAEEGYRFCSLCQRSVSRENQHCVHCNSCTSKDGRKWSHCFLCKKCVKPSWLHCNTCNRCALPDHSCSGPKDGCFICGALDHKRSSCPNIGSSRRANKAVRKQKQRKRNKMRRDAPKDSP